MLGRMEGRQKRRKALSLHERHLAMSGSKESDNRRPVSIVVVESTTAVVCGVCKESRMMDLQNRETALVTCVSNIVNFRYYTSCY